MDNPQDKISKLLSDPENIKTIAQIAAGFMPSGDTAVKPDADAAESEEKSAEANADTAGTTESTGLSLPPESVAASAQKSTEIVSGGLLGGIFGDTFTPEKVDKGIGFLGALKPYLGTHKKEVCDIMIKALGAAKLLTIYKN